MKKNILLIICISTLAFLVQGINAQDFLISADQFSDMLKENAELVIIDANKSKGYKAAHLEDAIFLNHNDLYQDGEIKGMIKSAEELSAQFAELGIGDGKTVVLTDDGSNKYTSRIFWILDYLGFDKKFILHKELKSWRDARLPQTSKSSKVSPAAQFTLNVRPEIFASIEDVDNAIIDPNVILIDARTQEEFSGNHKNSEGHIPTAVNLNFEDLLTETGAFKSKDELMQLAQSMGLTPDKELIFYCRTSVRAGVSYVAFKKILEYPKIKVYDGAYNEWFAKREVVQ